MALILGIAITPLRAQTPPVEDREVVLLGDGKEDFAEFDVQPSPGLVSYIHRYKAQGDGGMARQILGASAYRQDGVVRLELSVLTGDEKPRSKPFEDVPYEGMTRVPLGNYTVPPSGSLSLNTGAPYGFPVLQFRLGTAPGKCVGDLGNISVTPSLRIIGLVRRDGGRCGLALRNTSAKRVLSVGVELRDAKGEVISENERTYLSHPIEKELTIEAFGEGKPGQADDLGERRLAITYCLFEDGTYEGLSEPAKLRLATISGYASQSSRFLAFLQSLPPSQDNLPSVIQLEISRLPETDATLEEKLIARLATTHADWAREHFRSGLHNGKMNAMFFLQEYEARHQPGGPSPEPGYWQVRQQRLATIVQAATKALGGWVPEPSLVVSR